MGRSLERRRPSAAAAAEDEDAAGVGIGICSSGGSRGAMLACVLGFSVRKRYQSRPGAAALNSPITINVDKYRRLAGWLVCYVRLPQTAQRCTMQ